MIGCFCWTKYLSIHRNTYPIRLIGWTIRTYFIFGWLLLNNKCVRKNFAICHGCCWRPNEYVSGSPTHCDVGGCCPYLHRVRSEKKMQLAKKKLDRRYIRNRIFGHNPESTQEMDWSHASWTWLFFIFCQILGICFWSLLKVERRASKAHHFEKIIKYVKKVARKWRKALFNLP